MSSEAGAAPAIEVRGLTKRYRLNPPTGAPYYGTLRDVLARRGPRTPRREFLALDDVSFDVGAGEILGIVGRNGAGKSTLLKILSRVSSPTAGTARIRGRVGSLLEVGTGFHPELSGKENIHLNGAILGMSRLEVARKLDEIVEFAGVADFLDTPVKRYSSGMYLRLAFSVAAHLEPDILLVDEVLAVGDAEFQKKCLGRMGQVSADGRTVLFVSHSMPAILRLCPRLIMLDKGVVVADGPAHAVARRYMADGGQAAGERTWTRGVDAPGDEDVALLGVRVFGDDVDGADGGVEIGHPVRIEVRYWNAAAKPGLRPSAYLTVRNEDGLVLFRTQDHVNARWRASGRHRGQVTATCVIPAHFLSEGRHFVDVGLSSPAPHIDHVEEADATSFLVVDRSGTAGVRGDWAGEWPGVLRPLLEWQVTEAAD